MIECLRLFYTFLKIGFVSFGGGYAMLSMVMTESEKFAVTAAQLADLNALDMVVPGPIAINAATYVGYLYYGLAGATAATIGVALPSFIIVSLIMRFFKRFKDNPVVEDVLSGIRPAAVGLIIAAAYTIASGVLLNDGFTISDIFSNLAGAVSFISVVIFILTAVLNIRFKVNPILLTVLAGVAGAFLLA